MDESSQSDRGTRVSCSWLCEVKCGVELDWSVGPSNDEARRRDGGGGGEGSARGGKTGDQGERAPTEVY